MGDSFLNILFIVAIAVVFIGRTISAAQKKKEPPPKVTIPVHFEDDDDEPGYLKNLAEASVSEEVPKKSIAPKVPRLVELKEEPLFSKFQDIKTSEAPPSKGGVVRTAAASEEQKSFPLNLNKLSPMKQAVVMAEILGPPKGLQ